MSHILIAIVSFIDGFMEKVGRLVSWSALALMLVVCGDVLLRYLFSLSYVASRELEWHLFALLFLLGAGYTLKHDKHVRVDVFYQGFPPRLKAAINVAGCLLLLFPGCFLVIKTSLPSVIQAWQIGEGSPDPGGIPARYLIKAVLPLGFALIAVQGFSFFCRSLLGCAGIRLRDKG
jgi:TRAP-type mannitol/chloroaromatic compound transport system permease small subunit